MLDMKQHTDGNLSIGTSNLTTFFTTGLVVTPGAPFQPIDDA